MIDRLKTWLFGKPDPAPAPDPVNNQARAVVEAFKLAQRSRTSANWEPRNIAHDTAVAEAVDLGLARARELVRNTPQFKKAKGALVDLVVGPGVQAYANPFSAVLDEGDLERDLNYLFESDRWFSAWADDPQQCDAEGKLSWWDLQRLAFSEVVEVGDALLLRTQSSKPGRLVPLCYQILEREQLDRTKDRPRGPNVNKIVNGIELDRFDSPVAYWLYDAHPNDSSYATPGDSVRIPADRVIHIYLPWRPSANVGFSWFHAMGQGARDRHWLLGSELTKAAIGALLTLVHYREDPSATPIGIDDGDATTDAIGNELVKLATGGISMQAGLNEKVEMFNPQTPSQTLPQFVDVIDHDNAGGLELSHLRFTGRWAGLSYTAGRGAQLDDDAHAKPLKNWWGRSAVMPVRRAVNSQMVAMGHLRTITERELLRDPRWNSFEVVAPGREYLDPEGETDSAVAKLRAGLSTLQIECGKQSLHWIRVLRQMALERKIADRFGVVLDFSKGQGGITTRTTTAATAATEAK